MTAPQILTFGIIGCALVLFVWGRIRYDLVAVAALLLAVLTKVVPADDAFAGFGHPAVITVAAILILSRALRNSGAIERISELLQPFTKSTTLHVLGLTLAVAFCSAFMNNVGALAIFLPVALQSAYDTKRPAALLLMPIAFASLLGGLTTLIGTPPNIIISALRKDATGEPFAMFDFTPVGLTVMAVGLLFIALAGWRLIPLRQAEEPGERPLMRLDDYITEVQLPPNSSFVGRRLVDLETLVQDDASVVALTRRKDRLLAPSGFLRLQAGDILTIESDTEALKKLVDRAGLEIVGASGAGAGPLTSERVGVVEVVVTPGSRMEGRTARSLRLHTRYGVNLLAVSRQGEPINERLGQVRIHSGDVLLLQGEHEAMPEAFSVLGCLPLAERNLSIGGRERSFATPVIFAAAVLFLVAGIVPPHIAFVMAALGVVLVGDISLRDLYESIDWPIVVLLGSMIPVGEALQTTGGTQVIAGPLLALQDVVSPWVILALLMLVTMLLSDIINNAATAVLMGPLAIAVAQGLGHSIDPYLIAVAIGASSTFLTPIGHQSNLLVMGPGGYRFGDYWRMGLPLDLLIIAIAVPTIMLIWPL